MKKRIVLLIGLVLAVSTAIFYVEKTEGSKSQLVQTETAQTGATQTETTQTDEPQATEEAQPGEQTNSDTDQSSSESNTAKATTQSSAPTPASTPASASTPAQAPKPTTPTTPASTPKSAPKPQSQPQPQPQPATQLSAEKQKMLNLINSERAKAGLAPLSADLKVTEVAQVKSGDMVKNNYFSHTSPTYGSPFDMLRKFGVSFSAAAENIALNSSVEAAHAAFMASAGHRNNIINPVYTSIGIGITDGPQGKVIVQMFIKK